MNEAAAQWCLSVAGERVHGTTHQRPLDVLPAARGPHPPPLPAQPFELVTWTQGKVAPDCHVQVGRVLYSVPYRYLGPNFGRAPRRPHRRVLPATRNWSKTHLRLPDGRRQTDWNDYPPEKAHFFQRTPDWCRTQARAARPAVGPVVDDLLAQHALHYLRQCQGIIGLADKYGPERLNAACQLALAYGDPAYRTVRNILLKRACEGQDPLPWSDGRMEPGPPGRRLSSWARATLCARRSTIQ